MPKKRRVFGQAGSFISPFLRYLVEMRMTANPADENGSKILLEFYKMCLHQNPAFLQPTFIFKYGTSIDCRSSTLYIKYLNGWEKTYFLEKTTLRNVLLNMGVYNHQLEGIRALQGQDDEMEDELRII